MFEDLFDDPVRRPPRCWHCGGPQARIAQQDHAVAETFGASAFTSSGKSVASAFHHGVGLHGAIKSLRSARTYAQREAFMVPRALDDRQHVVYDGIVHGIRRTASRIRQFFPHQHARGRFSVSASGGG